MPRQKKDAVRLSVKLDRTISELLDQYCQKTGENKTAAIEKILNESLRKDYKTFDPLEEEVKG